MDRYLETYFKSKTIKKQLKATGVVSLLFLSQEVDKKGLIKPKGTIEILALKNKALLKANESSSSLKKVNHKTLKPVLDKKKFDPFVRLF